MIRDVGRGWGTDRSGLLVKDYHGWVGDAGREMLRYHPQEALLNWLVFTSVAMTPLSASLSSTVNTFVMSG